MFRTSLAALTLLATTAAADPVGSYTVEGLNPGNRGGYEGTVEIARTGETYVINWKIGTTTYRGTGIGMQMIGGAPSSGGASGSDIALAISYGDGAVLMVVNPDGSLFGHWTGTGGKTLGTETWLPR